jgi:hypothetical protein
MASPADRQRLDALAHPPGVQDLAEAARDAARESGAAGRIAWLCVAVALTGSESPDEARETLTGMLEEGKLRTTALACLAALCGKPSQAGPAARGRLTA